ncbi:hypothetical protein WMY93_022528 [Mugilogobius chulae]|uniref:PAS domain-containing protein n=1 Tax=Mugilogobius chulae TaxID=88201 RepID=A0AAW0NE94_9GOBI
MNTAMYAVKKRKKPVQKIPKAPPPEGAKSNPSKRHRGPSEWRTGEADQPAALQRGGPLTPRQTVRPQAQRGIPQSQELLQRHSEEGPRAVSVGSAVALGSARPQVTSIDGVSFSEGDLLLQALNGFVLVVTAEGYIFYTSPTIQDFLGFHQSDVVHQSVFELIHTEDRALFRQQLHFALDPNTSSNDQSSTEVSTNLMNYDPKLIPQENTSFLERNFCCRFRCLLDNSSGFLALNFYGRLKYLHASGHPGDPNKTLLFQTKHKLDFTPLGIDARGEVVLGYTATELCAPGSGYHFVHAADMMYCADQHLRMMKTGFSGFTIFRLLTKGSSWQWVQSNARLVFKGGKPDFVIARMKALTNEEGEEHLRLRRLQLPFNCSTEDSLLYDLTPSVEPPDQCSAPKQRKTDNSPPSISSMHDVAFRDTHATLSVPGDLWPQSSNAATGTLVKTESNVQDMMDTLQQVLGDSSLVSSLGVEPEELRSWESTLMSLNVTSSDLNSVLSRDILSFVEEQFQKEGGFTFLDHLEDIPRPAQELQLHVDSMNDIMPKIEPQDTARLSHLEPPALNGPVPVSYNFGAESQNKHRAVDSGFPLQCSQPQSLLKTHVNGNSRLSQSSAEQLQPRQAAPPPPLHHPEQGSMFTQTPLHQGFNRACPQWNYSLISAVPSGAPPGSEQTGLAPAQANHRTVANGYHHMGQSQTSGGPQGRFSQDERAPVPSSCMFSKPCMNGVHLSSEHHTEASRPYCLYQQPQEVPDPSLSCHKIPSFSLDTLLQPAQPFHFGSRPR